MKLFTEITLFIIAIACSINIGLTTDNLGIGATTLTALSFIIVLSNEFIIAIKQRS